MKSLRTLWLLCAIVLLAPTTVRAYNAQVIISSGCAAQVNPIVAWGCYDAVLNELFVWNGSAFAAISGSGTVTSLPQQVNGPAITSNTTTPVITLPTNTWFAANYSGATIDVQIQACLNALPANGGTCDASGITGTKTLAATIVVPANEVLKLGCGLTIDATVNSITPAITQGNGSALFGCPSGQGSLTFPTVIKVASGGTGDTSTLNPNINNNWSVQNIEFLGPGIDDTSGSVGVDLIGSIEVLSTNNYYSRLNRGMRIGGNGDCACYNKSQNDWFGQDTYGADLQQTANLNSFLLDNFHGATTDAFKVGTSAGEGNWWELTDIESIGSGNGWDIAGNSNVIDNPICEAGSGYCVQFESTAYYNEVLGMGFASSMSAVNYGTADQHTNVVQMLVGGGIGGHAIWPQWWGAYNLSVGDGSETVYTAIAADTFASGVLGDGVFFVGPATSVGINGTAETQQGLTGHAQLGVGQLRTSGGINDSGYLFTNQITTPATPVCTATCEPSDTANCASPATTYEYAVVGHDYSTYSLTSGSTTKSATSNTCANSSTLISASAQNTACTGASAPIGCCTGLHTGTCVGELNTVTWTKKDGINKWDVVGNQDLVHSVTTNATVTIPQAAGLPGAVYSFVDTNNSPASYTPPSRNSTSDAQVAGGLIVGNPTGGDEGTGTLNATGLFINGSSKGMPFANTTVSATPATATVGCSDTTSAVASATTSMSCIASPQGAPSGSGNVSWSCYTTAGNVNVRLCELVSIVSPAAATYNVQVFN